MILETTTSQSPEQVLAAAKKFFTRRNPIYAAFLEQESPRHLTFRGQGIEEIAIGVEPAEAQRLEIGPPRAAGRSCADPHTSTTRR